MNGKNEDTSRNNMKRKMVGTMSASLMNAAVRNRPLSGGSVSGEEKNHGKIP